MTRSRLPFLLLLMAVLAAALLLRTWDLWGRSLWLDESWSRWMAAQPFAELWDSARRFDTHPPLYYSLLRLWTWIVPETPLGLRALSILAGVAMLPLAWRCGRKVDAGRWTAPFAMTAVAVSVPLVIAARQARPYALFALAFAAALWAALTLLREPGKRSVWIVYFLGFELVLWLHNLGILFGIALAGGLFLALLLQRRLRQELVPFLAVHALAGLLWLPSLLAILEQRRAWTQTWLRFAWSDVLPGLGSGLAAPGPAGLAVCVLALLGAGALLRRDEDRPIGILLLLGALLPAALAVLISSVASPVFLPRTLVPSVLPLLLLAGAGLTRLPSRPACALAAGLTVTLLAAASWAEVKRPPEERWGELAVWLDGRVGEGEEVWLLPNELALPFAYGAGSEPAYPVRGVPAPFPAPNHPGPRYTGTVAVPGVTAADSARLVEGARRRAVRGVWLVSRFPRWFDPEGNLAAALGAPAGGTSAFAPLLVQHYRLEPTAIPPPG